MTRRRTTLTGGQPSRTTGIVSGCVLKLARQTTGQTQENLAEVLGVDVTTVQGWESGRRPLSAMSTGGFLRLCDTLSRSGAPASIRRHLREAVNADMVLSTGIAAGSGWVDPINHPLAANVHRWSTTNLITWPILGRMPDHLHDFVSSAPRRGPTPRSPNLTLEERTRFFDHLGVVAERERGHGERLLRRQAVYLLGFDGRPEVVDWLRLEWHRAGRRKPKEEDIAGLLEARSASVALAATGDRTHLIDFVDHTRYDVAEVANLNYWAYWIGELDDEQGDDRFMLNTDARSWSGARLLRHLVDRLDSTSHYLPLNLSTLHSLVASRPSLLAWQPKTRGRLADALAMLVSTDNLDRNGRNQVAGLQYAIRIADRQYPGRDAS